MTTASSLKSGLLATITLGVGLVLILLGERVLGESRMLGTVAGAIAIAAAVGLRVVTFLRGKGDARAVEARLLGAYLAVVVSLGLYALTTTSGIGVLESLLGVGGDEARTRLSGA